jgi:hypothetical protein
MDNEAQIAEDLRKKTSPESGLNIGDGRYPEDTEPPKEEVDLYHQLTNPLENTLLKQQLSDYLQLSYSAKLDIDITSKVDNLLEWAVNTSQSRDFGDILGAIARKESEMGIRHRGDKLSRLYRDIKIGKQMKALQLQRETLLSRQPFLLLPPS